MTHLFLTCAVVGSVMLVLHLILNLFGHDHDAGHYDAHDAGFFFGVLSLRAIASGIAIFGIAGMVGISAKFSSSLTLSGAIAAALVMIAIVAILMRLVRSFNASGTVELSSAVDQIGTIYIPVPANFAGQGKVQIDVQNRTLELAAVTSGIALSTGTRVRVVQLVDGQTAEVVSVGMG